MFSTNEGTDESVTLMLPSSLTVRRPNLLNKLATAEDIAPLFKKGDYIGWSGKLISCAETSVLRQAVAGRNAAKDLLGRNASDSLLHRFHGRRVPQSESALPTSSASGSRSEAWVLLADDVRTWMQPKASRS